MYMRVPDPFSEHSTGSKKVPLDLVIELDVVKMKKYRTSGPNTAESAHMPVL